MASRFASGCSLAFAGSGAIESMGTACFRRAATIFSFGISQGRFSESR